MCVFLRLNTSLHEPASSRAPGESSMSRLNEACQIQSSVHFGPSLRLHNLHRLSSLAVAVTLAAVTYKPGRARGDPAPDERTLRDSVVGAPVHLPQLPCRLRVVLRLRARRTRRGDLDELVVGLVRLGRRLAVRAWKYRSGCKGRGCGLLASQTREDPQAATWRYGGQTGCSGRTNCEGTHCNPALRARPLLCLSPRAGRSFE